MELNKYSSTNIVNLQRYYVHKENVFKTNNLHDFNYQTKDCICS